MECVSCKKKLVEGATFCHHCGAKQPNKREEPSAVGLLTLIGLFILALFWVAQVAK